MTPTRATRGRSGARSRRTTTTDGEGIRGRGEARGHHSHSWASRTGYLESQRAGKVLENLPIEIQQRFLAIRSTLD
eukprot:3793750-Pyramimonas_sp.AAC.1